jgi:hypothetical protein
MRKKRIALLLGIMSLAGLFFWLGIPIDSPIAPQGFSFSTSDDLVEPDKSAARNEPTKAGHENPDGTTAANPDRLFACDPYLTESGPKLNEESAQESRDRWVLERPKISASLAHSEDSEHLLTAALIGFDRTSKEHLSAMEKALAADPDNKLTLWNFLHTCALHPAATMCMDGSIEKRAIVADGGNGLLWGKIAGYRMDRGDIAGALDALLKANTAPQFNDYLIEHTEMVERGLVAAADYPYRERVVYGISVGSSSMIKFYAPFHFCRKQAQESPEWLQACLEYGKRMESDAKMANSILMGNNLQKTMYEISGNLKKISEIDLRRQLIRDTMISGYRMDAQVLLSFDDQVMADYIQEWSVHGELRALQFLHEKVVRLSNQPGYDPCKLQEARE